MGIGVIVAVLLLYGSMVSMAALTRAVSERYLDNEITSRDAYSSVMRRVFPFLWTLFLNGLVVAGGMGLIFLVVGIGVVAVWAINPIAGLLVGILVSIPVLLASIFIGLMVTFTIPCFVLEGRSGFDAVRRSIELFRHQPVKIGVTTLLITFISSMISFFVSGIITAIFTIVGGGHPGTFLRLAMGSSSGVVQAMTQPIQIIAVILLYYDTRIRREGFDLEVMASELHGAPTEAWE